MFNPSGFEWQNIADDWADWQKWLMYSGGIGVPPERSWESWWEEEREHLRFSGKWGRMMEVILALRFFILQSFLVYRLSFVPGQSILIYGVPWLVIFLILFVIKFEPTERLLWRGIEAVSKNQIKLKARTRASELRSQATSAGGRKFRVRLLLKWLIVVFAVSILARSVTLPRLKLRDVILCFAALLMGGWGVLSIAQLLKPIMERAGLWEAIQSLAQGYDILMGSILFAPIAILAWLPLVSEMQSRTLFNQAFIRGLQIARILGRRWN
ncbi:hypothetical protein MLD38_031976 [Melastoma candidum]|uniref:Uncharacterized protein n=1 Tax=Melastoma candidum TaxID=119954 RepID=A0ACB9MT34_9MYRT|nr:hypothetical protein MLD38_031976 [Melastoma candidum]